jgi:hypothetical protein
MHVHWHVSGQGKSGLVVLNMSFVARDPEQIFPSRSPPSAVRVADGLDDPARNKRSILFHPDAPINALI